jgi:hypothetical protein
MTMPPTVTETFYPHLREVLDDRFAGLPDATLEAGFTEAFGEGVTPAEYEEFFSGLGRAFSSAAPVLSSIAKGAAGGAAVGSIGGPFGAIGGALVGGLGGGLSHAKGPAGDVGRGIGGVVNIAGGLTGRGGAAQGAAGIAGMLGGRPGSGGGNSAAAVLRATLSRPETLRALQALLGGGNPAIPLGGSTTAAPASAFAGLLGALSREAEAEAEEGSSHPSVVHGYLLDARGRPVVDPGDDTLRAARLLALLALTGGGGSRRDDPPDPAEAWDDALDESFDDSFDESADEGSPESWVDALDRWVVPAEAHF